MENMLKINNQIDRLVNDISSPTQLQPNQEKLSQLSQLVNSNNQFAKYLANCVKGKLSGRKHPKSQLYILELIEYTTVKGNRAIHNEYHQKQFLKIINTIFNQRDLPKNVKDKTLFLIQFWCYFFESQKDVLPNFEWFYKKIRSMKVQFPQEYQSKYEQQGRQMNTINSQQQLSQQQQQYQSNQNRQQVQQQPQQMTQQSSFQEQNQFDTQDSFDISSLSQKGQKLYNELQVVVSHVKNTNQQINSKNIQGAQQGLTQLGGMLPKVQSLPNPLQQSGEQFLYVYVNALINDMYFTKNRYDLWSKGQQVPNFDCKNEQVKQQWMQQLQNHKQQQQQQQQTSSRQVIDKYASLNQDLVVQNESSDNNIQSKSSFEQNNDQDPFENFEQNNNQQNEQGFQQKSNEQINVPKQNISSNDNLQNQQSAFDDFEDNDQTQNYNNNQQDVFDNFDQQNTQQNSQNKQSAFDDFNDLNDNQQNQVQQNPGSSDFNQQQNQTQNQQKDVFDDFDNNNTQQYEQSAFDDFNNDEQIQNNPQKTVFDDFNQQTQNEQKNDLFGDFDDNKPKKQDQTQQKQNMYFKDQSNSFDDVLF